MTICYFGIYNKKVARNQILIKGLRENGVRVIECHSSRRSFLKYFELVKKFLVMRTEIDCVIVGFPAGKTVFLAKVLSPVPVVLDVFVSMYDSIVWDRQQVKPQGIKAKYYFLMDKWSVSVADKVLLDTDAHIDYFVEMFGISRDKFCKIFVGSDPDTIYPINSSPGKNFIVHFHGTYIPLQGIEYIVRTAKRLEGEGILFRIIGSGQTEREVQNMYKDGVPKNVVFLPRVPYRELGKEISKADVVLGIFGHTEKTQRVIPNKVFEGLAVRKPVITGNTPAVRELLTDKKNVILCRVADPEDLKEKILLLKSNKELQETIKENGYQLFLQKLTPKTLGGQLLGCLKDTVYK